MFPEESKVPKDLSGIHPYTPQKHHSLSAPPDPTPNLENASLRGFSRSQSIKWKTSWEFSTEELCGKALVSHRIEY